MRYLVTGDAGFIGFHTARRLLDEGHQVLGIDCLTDYYDVDLKHRRLALLAEFPAFEHVTMMLEDHVGLLEAFARFRPERVIHLAAQAGEDKAVSDDTAVRPVQRLDLEIAHRAEPQSAVFGPDQL